jgi:hypothetical protein
MANERERGEARQVVGSHLSELQNVRVLLEEARGLSRNLAYYRRVRPEAAMREALDEVNRHIGEPRPYRE